MKKISDSLLRLFSLKNFIAIAIAYFFEVRLLYGIFNIVYWVLNGLFQHGAHSQWIISEHFLGGIVRTLFAIQLIIAGICQSKTEFGVPNRRVELWLNITLTLIMWPGFAIMLLLFVPTLYIVRGMRKIADKHIWAWFIMDVIVVLLSRAALFCLGTGRNVTGEFPKRGSFWKQFWIALTKNEWPKEKGYFIEFDHNGSSDYIEYGANTPFHTRVVAGTNLFKFPVIGQFIQVFSIPVDRTDPVSKKSAAEQMKQCIDRGWNVGAASAGRRKRREEPGLLRPYERWEDGIYVIACRKKTSVVPVSIVGTGEFKPPLKGVLPKPPISAIKKGRQFVRVFRNRNTTFTGKLRVVVCGVIVVICSLYRQIQWLARVMYEHQWYCVFTNTYFDICEEIPYKEGISPREFKLLAYNAMEAKKKWRYSVLEEEGDTYSWFRLILFLLFVALLLVLV